MYWNSRALALLVLQKLHSCSTFPPLLLSLAPSLDHSGFCVLSYVVLFAFCYDHALACNQSYEFNFVALFPTGMSFPSLHFASSFAICITISIFH